MAFAKSSRISADWAEVHCGVEVSLSKLCPLRTPSRDGHRDCVRLTYGAVSALRLDVCAHCQPPAHGWVGGHYSGPPHEHSAGMCVFVLVAVSSHDKLTTRHGTVASDWPSLAGVTASHTIAPSGVSLPSVTLAHPCTVAGRPCCGVSVVSSCSGRRFVHSASFESVRLPNIRLTLPA